MFPYSVGSSFSTRRLGSKKQQKKHYRFEFRLCLYEKVISRRTEISSAQFPCNVVNLQKTNGSRAIAPRKIAPNPKSNPYPNLNLTRGQFSSGAIAWLPPNPKTNLNLDQNANPNRGQFSPGGICLDNKTNMEVKSGIYLQFPPQPVLFIH